MDKSLKTLEFHIILDQLAQFALSDKAKEQITLLTPFMNREEVLQKLQETTEARKIMESFGNPPLCVMKEIENNLSQIEKGIVLMAEQLTEIAQFIYTCRRMRDYLKKSEALDIGVAYYGMSIADLSDLHDEIQRCIRNDEVDDYASPELRSIRRKIDNAQNQIKAKLDSILKSKRDIFSDSYYSTRNGRYVLPVKKAYKDQLSGTVIDTSSSGGTYFIEPAAVSKIASELSNLHIDEDNEVRKILYTLTALVEEEIKPLFINIEAMVTLDFVFAKAKLSQKMKAMQPQIVDQRRIKIVSGRHPLLKEESCVPLDFEIGGVTEGIVITGPNTGGKTVALKTIGLLSLMAQSGLHVPAEDGTVFCLNNLVLCDIGDGQSITENLSTFSSHITNIIGIIHNATNESLVLLDELGSGTDPAEGMGIAISILNELKEINCLFVATTHYPEIKQFANITKGIVNARMSFDRESLEPLYRLEIGEAGESCALYIAKRLGFPEHMLKEAYAAAYKNKDTNIFSGEQRQEKQPRNQLPQLVVTKKKKAPNEGKRDLFSLGDSVIVYPQKEMGIICKLANERNEWGVQIKGQKKLIGYKRLKMYIKADQMYPPDYDFSIIFDTVANRKARKKMEKGHDPNLVIEYEF